MGEPVGSGRTIERVEIVVQPSQGYPDLQWLKMTFVDGTALLFEDRGQCCEERWMHTDDDLSTFAGATYYGYEVAAVPDPPDPLDRDICEVHEMQFLNIRTSRGVLTIETHNEHNGWYGGFDLRVTEVRSDGR